MNHSFIAQVEYDDRTHTLSITHEASQTIQMKIKLEAGMTGTMTRCFDGEFEDCDNWWCAFKPGDGVVMDRERPLFGRTNLVVRAVDFSVEPQPGSRLARPAR